MQPNRRKERLRWLPLWREPPPLRLRSALLQRPCSVEQLRKPQQKRLARMILNFRVAWLGDKKTAQRDIGELRNGDQRRLLDRGGLNVVANTGEIIAPKSLL